MGPQIAFTKLNTVCDRQVSLLGSSGARRVSCQTLQSILPPRIGEQLESQSGMVIRLRNGTHLELLRIASHAKGTCNRIAHSSSCATWLHKLGASAAMLRN